MKTNAKNTTLYLCQAAMIAALYVVLTFLANTLGLANGVIQVRLSEMLCLLPVICPAAIPGVTVGCFLASLLTGAHWADILIGPLATLLGAFGTYALRKYRWLTPLPPILSNALIIPFVLAYGYGAEEAIWLMMITVGVGEILSAGVLGMICLKVTEKFLKKAKKS